MATDYRALDLPLQLRNWRKCGLRFIMGREANQELESKDAGPQSSFQPPEPWLSLWSKLALQPCPLLWTYFELGPDLLSSGPNQRRDLFSKICQHLDIPGEWIVFWPLSEQYSQGIRPRVDIFWQGVNRIKPSYLVIFGQKAMRLLYPEQAGQYGFYLQSSPSVLYLPGPEEMLPDNRQTKSFVWQMLLKLQKGMPAR